jgi:isoquinoline 1-oxidoreductase alpha subunit
MLQIKVNGADHQVDAAPDTPLLWVLRDHLDLTGTKYGCGAGLCGACTVHIDGEPVRSCVYPVAAAAGRQVRTIEDLGAAGLTALQQAWIRHQVPQCGYCQSGMLMAASSLLAKNPAPSDADIDANITNLCRCGTYQRIRAAIKDAGRAMAAAGGDTLHLTPAQAIGLAPAPAPKTHAAARAAAAGEKR